MMLFAERTVRIDVDALTPWINTVIVVAGVLFVVSLGLIVLRKAVFARQFSYSERVVASASLGMAVRLLDEEPGTGWDDAAVAVARHDAARARWDEWHTDLDLLIEYPAIHDVAHETFAVQIIDTAEDALKARTHWEQEPDTPSRLRAFSGAVDAFDKALRAGERQARLLGRGPSLDPVLKRVMDDAAHLVEVLRRNDTTADDRDRTMRALFKALKPVVGDRAVEIPELEPFVMKQLTGNTNQ